MANIKFGTDGWRAITDKEFNDKNVESVINAIAKYFGLPLDSWYPPQIAPSTPRLISWAEMCATIDDYYPISEESNHLKHHPEEFEAIRNTYAYRNEYF